MRIYSYLTFNGNCREAMNFYQECLGGDLEMQTLGESPSGEKMPPSMKEFVVHSVLSNDHLVLMGSDMVPETGLVKGNAVALCLACSDEKQTTEFYNRLSKDGVPDYPLQPTHWGGMIGNVTDKYGNYWLISYEKPSHEKV